jgi:hypothetical protein
MREAKGLPANSVLNKDHRLFHYIDSYQSSFTDAANQIGIDKVAKLFFTSGPKWIDKLFALRNKIVRLFGLKTSSADSRQPQNELNNFKGEKGEQIGLFKVMDKTPQEMVLGEDDKHLNFRVSLLLDTALSQSQQKNLIITTTVKFNNVFGRLYFLPVRIFHKLIVPSMLKGIIKEIEKENAMQVEA